MAPLLALDALYVWGGQRPDSVYFANWPNALALVVGFAIIVAGNWWAGRGLPGASRTVIAVVMAVLVWALASVPALFFMYWFHFAVGGSE